MAGISDKAVKTNYIENKFRYNQGSELQNKEFTDGSGLELYETGFRSYDPQIGRFHQSDPLTDSYWSFSSYGYFSNIPISRSDPSGAMFDNQASAPMDLADENDESVSGGGGGDPGGGNDNAGSIGGPFSASFASYLQSIWDNSPNNATTILSADFGNGPSVVGYTYTNLTGTFVTPNYQGLETFTVGQYFTNSGTTIKSSLPEFDGNGGASIFVNQNTGLDEAQDVLGTIGLSWDLTRYGIIGAQRLANAASGASYAIEDIGKLSLVKFGSLGNLTAHTAGTLLGIAGLAITAYDIQKNGLNWSNGTDAVMGAVAFVPVVG
jgi:RHS repeat-associated protein